MHEIYIDINLTDKAILRSRRQSWDNADKKSSLVKFKHADQAMHIVTAS